MRRLRDELKHALAECEDAMSHTPMMPYEEVKHLREVNAELLAALKYLVRTNSRPFFPDQREVMERGWEMARAAIRKAEGA